MLAQLPIGQELIGRNAKRIEHLVGHLLSGNGQTSLFFGIEKAELDESTGLIPVQTLKGQLVAAQIDDADHGDTKTFIGGCDAWQKVLDL